MKENLKIAIVGATGLVGKKIIEVLEERKIFANFTLFASPSEKGNKVKAFGKQYVLEEIRKPKPHEFDYAFFAVDANLSKTWAKHFKNSGCVVIDNSNAFRRKKSVPLIVPGVNDDCLSLKDKIIANPNCSTIQLMYLLSPLEKAFKIERAVVSTYQAVSGAGIDALSDLENGTTKKFIYPIKNNLIPHIDVFLKNNYTYEEDKVIFEGRKILCKKNLNISATAVRIPIKNCHSESINVTFKRKTTLKSIKNRLKNAKNIILTDNPDENLYPMPINADNKDEVFVGRIRKDYSFKNSYWFFIVADNLRRGAASNAVDIFLLRERLRNKQIGY